MNDEAARQGRPDTDHLSRSSLPTEAVELLLSDVARAAAFNHDPASSPLWIHAPWSLRREYADARCDRETFWLMLGRWLSFRASIERDAA